MATATSTTLKLPNYIRQPGKSNKYNGHRVYVGKRGNSGYKNEKIQFTLGVYGFTNPVTAIVFGYLFHEEGYSSDIATQVGVDLEEKAGINLLIEMCRPSWIDIIPASRAVKMSIKIAKRAGSTLGKFVESQQEPGFGSLNPKDPKNLSGFYDEAYVEYALGYWAKHPKAGPAYKFWRNTVGKSH